MLPGMHEWEMVSGFVLSLGLEKSGPNECMLVPVGEALMPFNLTDEELCQISIAVENAGEEMRHSCLEGKLNCINVRIYTTKRMVSGQSDSGHPVKYFMNQLVASSESDNLEAMDDPCCYIDLYVYRPA